MFRSIGLALRATFVAGLLMCFCTSEFCAAQFRERSGGRSGGNGSGGGNSGGNNSGGNRGGGSNNGGLGGRPSMGQVGGNGAKPSVNLRQNLPGSGLSSQRQSTVPPSTNRPSFSSDRQGTFNNDRITTRPNSLSFPGTQKPGQKLPPISGNLNSGSGNSGIGNGLTKPNLNRPPNDLGTPFTRPTIKPAPKPITRPSLGNTGQPTTLPGGLTTRPSNKLPSTGFPSVDKPSSIRPPIDRPNKLPPNVKPSPLPETPNGKPSNRPGITSKPYRPPTIGRPNAPWDVPGGNNRLPITSIRPGTKPTPLPADPGWSNRPSWHKPNWNAPGWNRPDWGWGNNRPWDNGPWQNQWQNHCVHYHYHGWYNGCWNGYWGSNWYAPVSWGAGNWGLATYISTWGTPVRFYNPYYVVAYRAPLLYDYSRPIVVNNYIPIDDAVNDPFDQEPLESKNALVRFDEGLDLFRMGDYVRAMSRFDEALQHRPNDPVIHEVRALTLFALGRYDESAAILNSLLASAPGMDWTTVSGLYGNIDLYTQQLRRLEAFCDTNPRSSAAHFVLSYHYLVLGEKENAVSVLRVVVGNQPKDVTAKRMLDALTLEERNADVRSELNRPRSLLPSDQAEISESTELGVETNLIGSWVAVAGPTTIELRVTEDSKFQWKALEQGKVVSELSGDLVSSEMSIALETVKEGTMAGRVTSMGPDRWRFQVEGAPENDPGLTFERR